MKRRSLPAFLHRFDAELTPRYACIYGSSDPSDTDSDALYERHYRQGLKQSCCTTCATEPPTGKLSNFGENGTGASLSDDLAVVAVDKLNGFLGICSAPRCCPASCCCTPRTVSMGPSSTISAHTLTRRCQAFSVQARCHADVRGVAPLTTPPISSLILPPCWAFTCWTSAAKACKTFLGRKRPCMGPPSSGLPLYEPWLVKHFFEFLRKTQALHTFTIHLEAMCF